MSSLAVSTFIDYETPEERKKRIDAVFDSFDSDHNGTIDKNEFINGMSVFCNMHNLRSRETYMKFFETIFNMCDSTTFLWFFTIKDGVISREEFTRIANAMPNPMSKDIIENIGKMMFNIIDKDHSGAIDKKEMKEFLKYSPFTKQKLGEFMLSLDDNGDGQIQLDEFMKWFRQLDDN